MKTFREYLISTKYKSIFNELYKLYLKGHFSDKQITELDLSISSYVDELKSLPPKTDIDHEIHIVEKDGEISVHCDHHCECHESIDDCPIIADPALDHIDLNVKTDLEVADATICAVIINYLSNK